MPPFNVPSGMEAMDTDSTSSELSKMMESELAKGSDSTVPQDTLASIGALRDYLTGTATPTRAGYDQAVGQDLSDITQRKQDLIKRLSSGDQLTASQTMGLAILALGLAAAGGAAKGKLGLAAAGNAFNVGGQVFLKQSEDENKAKRAIGLQQLGDLNKAQTSLTGELAKSKMGDVVDEEKTQDLIKKDKALMAAGIPVGGGTSINFPDAASKERLDAARVTLSEIDKVQKFIQQKYPLQLKDGESWADAAARQGFGKVASDSDQKELNSMLEGLILTRSQAISTRPPTAQEAKMVQNQITGGGVYSLPFLMRRLDDLKDEMALRIETPIDTQTQLKQGGGVAGLNPSALLGRPTAPGTIGDQIRSRLADNSAQSAPAAPAKAPVTPATPAGSKTSYSVTLKDGSTRTVGSAFEVQQLIDQGLL